MFCSDKHLTVGILDHFDCYTTLKNAVLTSYIEGVDVKTKIGNELLGMLDQVFQIYYDDYEDAFEEYEIGTCFKSLSQLLGFNILKIN